MSIEKAFLTIQQTIADACRRTGRDPQGIRVLAVTKTVPVEKVREAASRGIRFFGENRVQEAETKIQALGGDPIHWHLIGPLQTNKINKALSLFECLEALDREDLAEALNKRAFSLGKTVRCLLEINIGGEASKHGMSEDGAEAFVKRLREWPALRVEGLMTVAPYQKNPEMVRPYFKRMKNLFERLKAYETDQLRMTVLSMGMSHDYAAAVEEGATEVRIGTALFGERT